MTLSYQSLPPCKTKFSRAQMQATNRRLHLGVLLLKNPRYNIECTLLGELAQPIAQPCALQMPVHNQQTLYAQVPRAMLNALTQPQTTPAPSDVLQTQTQLGLIMDNFSTPLSTLEQRYGTRFAPTLANQSMPQQGFLAVRCHIEAMHSTFEVAISLEGNAAKTEQFFAECSTPVPHKSNAMLPLQATVGFLRLSRRQMASMLQPGSIVVPQAMPSNPVYQSLGIYPHDAGGPLIVVQLQRQDSGAYSALSPLQFLPAVESAVSSSVSAADIPLTLTFVLSRLGVRADALSQIKEGFVFDAGKAVEQRPNHIDIMLNDRVIAHGELVQVGENYGVLVHSTL